MLAWLALPACGRFDFAPRAAAADAPAADAPCTWGPFATPVALVGDGLQSGADDWAPTPTLGGLGLYFYSYREGASPKIFHAERSSTTAPFDPPIYAMDLAVGTGSGQRASTLTADALDILFENGGGMIYEATRTSVAMPFSTPQPVTPIDGGGAYEPFMTADGLRLVFDSPRSSTNGTSDLFETTRPSLAAPFGPPVVLAPLRTSSDERTPTLSDDGLDVYFASDRPGGPGGFDVYHAHRAAVDQPFDAPALVPELSSPLDDIGLRLSRDGSAMYLNFAAMDNGTTDTDLEVATRSCR